MSKTFWKCAICGDSGEQEFQLKTGGFRISAARLKDMLHVDFCQPQLKCCRISVCMSSLFGGAKEGLQKEKTAGVPAPHSQETGPEPTGD